LIHQEEGRTRAKKRDEEVKGGGEKRRGEGRKSA